MPVVHRTLGGSHYPGGDEKLPQADADRADCRPLAIVLIGPLGIWIGSAISALVYTIHGYLGWLSVAIMGALWPLLVMTGMHRVFTPTIIQTIAETGKEGMVMPSEIGANLSLGGSSLAVAWKTKTRSCARRR